MLLTTHYAYDTAIGPGNTDVVSYELWTRCNVPTLEFCPTDSSTDSSTTDTMPTDNAIIPDSSTADTMPTDDAIIPVVAKILYAVSTMAAILLTA